MKKIKKNTVYAFIDSQNLNLGIRSLGWNLDFKRFRVYLKDKYDVKKAFLFIGYIPKNRNLYNHLQSSGYELVFKTTVKDNRGKPKGNVDAELIVWAMRSVYEKICDKVIIVSGDGDFAVLADFLLEKNKLLNFIAPNYKSMSILIKKTFSKKKKMSLLSSLNNEKGKLEIKKPLYRSGNR